MSEKQKKPRLTSEERRSRRVDRLTEVLKKNYVILTEAPTKDQQWFGRQLRILERAENQVKKAARQIAGFRATCSHVALNGHCRKCGEKVPG